MTAICGDDQEGKPQPDLYPGGVWDRYRQRPRKQIQRLRQMPFSKRLAGDLSSDFITTWPACGGKLDSFCWAHGGSLPFDNHGV
jgi:hypothetical protein